jgi:muskelin
MILDPPTSTLYIFAGQRNDRYLSDMYAYDLHTNVATQLQADFTASGGPDASFTQRAVGDAHEREVYV